MPNSSEFFHFYFEIIVELQEVVFKNVQGGPGYPPFTQLPRGAGDARGCHAQTGSVLRSPGSQAHLCVCVWVGGRRGVVAAVPQHFTRGQVILSLWCRGVPPQAFLWLSLYNPPPTRLPSLTTCNQDPASFPSQRHCLVLFCKGGHTVCSLREAAFSKAQLLTAGTSSCVDSQPGPLRG